MLKLFALSSLTVSHVCMAQSYSYTEAERFILENSKLSQSQNLLQQSAQLEKEALKNLGLPRVDLNARAYAFHSEVDVPLDQFKQKLEDQLSQRVNDRLSEFENIGVPSQALGNLESGINNIIQQGIAGFSDTSHLTLEDQVFRPTISATMPIYTGGLTTSAKKVAEINAQKSQINQQQQQDLQRFNLIEQYFNVQLQKQLVTGHQHTQHAMQQHLNNALKLEKQGFISKGQRMQFEVAYNNATRLLMSSQNQLLASEYSLKTVLANSDITTLSTPLFINLQTSNNLDDLLVDDKKDVPIVQNLQLDQQLASEKIQLQKATQKPKVFAFGEYALDSKDNWIVGVMANYNLFSGIDQKKQIQAAQLQQQATVLLTEQSKQDLNRLMVQAYMQMTSAQQNHRLLKQNVAAAKENLRIQTLSFKEDMGTANQVIDAENSLYQLQSELALNAYRYVIALATLLNTQGKTEQFKTYISAVATDYIGN